jgi:hypothetical protein
MKHFYFTELNTGEEFIVGADTLSEAMVVAEEIGIDIVNNYGAGLPKVKFEYEMTEFEAEASGLDEY